MVQYIQSQSSDLLELPDLPHRDSRCSAVSAAMLISWRDAHSFGPCASGMYIHIYTCIHRYEVYIYIRINLIHNMNIYMSTCTCILSLSRGTPTLLAHVLLLCIYIYIYIYMYTLICIYIRINLIHNTNICMYTCTCTQSLSSGTPTLNHLRMGPQSGCP